MNKSSLSKILGKKGLTGAELGRLAILNNVELLKNYHNNKKGEGFFTEDEINATAKNLTDYQKDIYCYYLDLYKVINLYFNIGNTMYQQAMNASHRLMLRITLLWEALRRENQTKSLPLMVTEEKYKELKKLSDKEAFSYKEDYIDLFTEALSYYVEQYEQNPEADNIITKFLKAHEGKPVKSKYLIDTYIGDNFHDYYSYHEDCSYKLMNGDSSEDITVKEYMEDFLKRPLLKELEQEDIDNIKERFRTKYRGILRVLKGLEKDYTGLDFSDLEDRLEDKNKATAPRVSGFIDDMKDYLTAVGKEKLADDIDELQRELLIVPKEAEPTQKDLIQYYSFLISPYEDEADNIKVFEAFKIELPDVAEAIEKDLMKHKVIKTAIQGKSNKALYKPLISWEDLYKADIYTYRDKVENVFKDENPQARNGIAIIKEDEITAKRIKEGIYTPDTRGLDADGMTSPEISVENLKTFKQNILNIIDKVLLPAVKNVYAINFFYRDLEDIYKIEGLKEAYGQDTEDIISKIEAINGMADMVCTELYELYKGTKEGNIKTEYVKQAFKYIDMEDILPDKEQQEQAKEVLADVKNFKGKDFSPKFLYLYVKGSPNTLQVVNDEK